MSSSHTTPYNPFNKLNVYMNTIVFSFVTVVILVVLIVAQYKGKSDILQKYIVFVVTLQIGLLMITIYALYKVLNYESMLKKSKNDKRRLRLLSCPDYWTLNEDGKGSRICERTYNIPDGKIVMPGVVNSIDLNKYDMQLMKDVCKNVKNDLGSNGVWSALKSECDAYNFS